MLLADLDLEEHGAQKRADPLGKHGVERSHCRAVGFDVEFNDGVHLYGRGEIIADKVALALERIRDLGQQVAARKGGYELGDDLKLGLRALDGLLRVNKAGLHRSDGAEVGVERSAERAR